MTSTNSQPTEHPDQAEATEAKKNAAKAPTPSTSATTNDLPEFGWTSYAERVNGRFAMIGFVTVLLIEALSSDTFLHWAGFVP